MSPWRMILKEHSILVRIVFIFAGDTCLKVPSSDEWRSAWLQHTQCHKTRRHSPRRLAMVSGVGVPNMQWTKRETDPLTKTPGWEI